MISKRIIEQVLYEQREEIKALSKLRLCSRKEESLVDLDSNMAQVIIGVRRSGKSTLCYKVLRNHKFAYVNFDDERLISLSSEDLNTVLEVCYKVYPDFEYLFLDEVQNVDSWFLFVNRLLRQQIRVLITGSNAKLLSGEFATHLTGRYEEVRLLPFSFSEYCQFKQINTKAITTSEIAFLREAFDQYLKQGGFPELINKKDKTRYVDTLVKNILKRDIQMRHTIRYQSAFELLSQHLLNVSPVIFVAMNLAKIFGFQSHHTAENYVEFLKQAFLFVGVKKLSYKSHLRVREEKLYPIDVALMDFRTDAFAKDNLGPRLETIVLLELKRRANLTSSDVYYYRNAQGYEADFVVCKKNQVEGVYQVSYDISNPKTLNREIRGLIATAKDTGCDNLYLITDFESKEMIVEDKLIKIIPAYEWLVGQSVL